MVYKSFTAYVTSDVEHRLYFHMYFSGFCILFQPVHCHGSNKQQSVEMMPVRSLCPLWLFSEVFGHECQKTAITR